MSKPKEKYVLIIDKVVPFELIRNYVILLWNYKDDDERGRAHDKIFEYMEVDRHEHDEDSFYNKYAKAVGYIICEAFCCCGLSVNRYNVCIGKCTLTPD